MQSNLRTYQFQLIAGVEFNAGNISGDVYAVLSNTSPFTVVFGESNRLGNQEVGMGAKFPQDYNEVKFLSSVTQTVVVLLGFGDFRDSRASVNVANLSTTIEGSNQTINTGDVTVGSAATLLASARSDRKEIEICLPSDAVAPIRVGNATVSATSGSIIEAGTSKVFDSEAAWYAIRTGASDETVTVVELVRV